MNADRLNGLLQAGRVDADNLEPDLAAAYASEINAAARRAARALRRSQETITAAAEDWTPPPWPELLAAATLGITFTAIRAARLRASQAAAAPLADELDLDIDHDRLVGNVVERAESLAAQLGPEIRYALHKAREEGLSVRQAARLLESEIEEMAVWQANLMARSDILSVSNQATHAAVEAANEKFRAAGEPEFRMKRWVTAHDDRVRPTHAEADGQTRPIAEPFSVGGSHLAFPCDPGGNPNETWNCRCVATYEESAAPQTVRASGEVIDKLSYVEVRPDFSSFMEQFERAVTEPISPQQAEMLIERYKNPPLAALPSPETQEDTVSADPVTVEVPITSQFGIGVFAGEGETPISFMPLDTIEENGSIVGFTCSGAGTSGNAAHSFDAPQNGVYSFDLPQIFPFFSSPARGSVLTPQDLVAAVTITVDENEAAPEASEPIPWEGVLTVEGLETGDGRYMFPGCFTWRELPLTLMAMVETTEGGHLGAQVAGRIDEIWKVDAPDLGADATRVMGRGIFDGGAFGQEIARMVSDQTLRGVSVDPGATPDVVLLDEDMNEVPDDEMDIEKLFAGEYLFGFKSYQIGAATLCPVPALKDATIAVLSVDGRTLVASTFGIEVGGEPPAALVAAAAPIEPPRAWFEMPEADELTPMTITAEGQVYGHAATWECHESHRDRCMMAPRSRTNLAYFHTGEILTAEGDLIPVGRWTVYGPHAPLTASRAQAQQHYSDASAVGAYLRAVEGRHGTWVCGAVKNDATPEQIRDMRGNPPSGDWRGGELILVHSVPNPGLPVFRHEARVMVASDGQEEVAALITPPVDCGCEADLSEYEIRIGALAQLAGIE